MTRWIKKLVPYVMLGALAIGAAAGCKKKEDIYSHPSLEGAVESLTPSPLQSQHGITSEMVAEIKSKQPRECVLASEVLDDIDQRTDDLLAILKKVPKVGEKTSDFFSKARKYIIQKPREFTKKLEEKGMIKETCPAFRTWSTNPAKWNVTPSLSLRIYQCMKEVPKERCTDGIDNDCDGKIDKKDPDCYNNQPNSLEETARKFWSYCNHKEFGKMVHSTYIISKDLLIKTYRPKKPTGGSEYTEKEKRREKNAWIKLAKDRQATRSSNLIHKFLTNVLIKFAEKCYHKGGYTNQKIETKNKQGPGKIFKRFSGLDFDPFLESKIGQVKIRMTATYQGRKTEERHISYFIKNKGRWLHFFTD